MKMVKNNAIPINTMLGGVCCIPKAFLVKDKIMMVLTKEVIIISSDGSSITAVIINRISKVGTPFPFMLIKELVSIFFIPSPNLVH